MSMQICLKSSNYEKNILLLAFGACGYADTAAERYEKAGG